MTENTPIKSLQTSLELVETLANLDGATVAELTEQMEMPKSTIYDHLRTLRDEEYIVSCDGGYRLSYRVLGLGGQLRRQRKVFQIARPELQSLAEETGEHASLIVEENGHGVVLHTEVGRSMERAVVHIGSRAYLHTTAPGKAILADFSEARRTAILERHGLSPVTENTITDRETLESELEAVRTQGYATDYDEVLQGMRGIGTTIEDRADGEIEAAISIYGPTTRGGIDELTEALVQTANIIEVNLVYD